MTGLGAALRRILRSLGRSPGFSAITVVTLAVAIGANSAIFSIVNGVLLKPLPYPESDRLVYIGHAAPLAGFDEITQATGTYATYREQAGTLEDLAIYWRGNSSLTGDGEPERVMSAAITASMFNVLRTPAALGRAFTEDEMLPDSEPLIILGHGMWQRRFGSDPGVLDRSIVVDGVSRRIVGVMPAGFNLPRGGDIELYMPFELDPAELTVGNYSFPGIGRLAEGATLEGLQADLERIVPTLPELFPGDMLTPQLIEEIGFAPTSGTLVEEVTGDIKQTLIILLGAVGLVLLIACANVANLFLVRAESRQKEMAVRSALGAERGTLVKHFLGESTVLAILGGIAGLALAYGGIQLLTVLGPNGIPRLDAIRIDGTVLGFTLAVSVMVGLLFGIAPVFRYTAPELITSLREGRGNTIGRSKLRARSVLVLGQIALSFLLLVCSGLMVKSFWHLKNVDPGFESENVLTMWVSLPDEQYDDGFKTSAFYMQLVDRLEGLPGVQSVGASTKLPLRGPGESHSGILIEDKPVEPGSMPHVELSLYVAPGYFETFGIRLLEGRTIERADITGREGAVVVNRTFAKKFWPGESVIGKRVWPGLADDREDESLEFGWWTVVGVVDDVHNLALDEEILPIIYYAMVGPGFEERNRSSMGLILKASSAPTSLAPMVRDAVWAIDANVPIADLQTMESVVADASSRTAFAMLMLVIAALMALLLGSLGIYGVISYGVSQRTQEIGVRMALGAPASQVSNMIVKQGAIVAGIGLVAGFVAALGLTRLMEALLFEVRPTDPPTFGLVVALLMVVSLLASWIPARRAARVDPMVALRAE